MEKQVTLLKLSTWGAGRGISYINFYVYEDGKFMKEEGETLEPSQIIENGDEKIFVSEQKSTKYMGTLVEEKFNNLRKFLDENVKESQSRMMFDAGYMINYKDIEIKNNTELYNQITKLVPYDVKKTD